MRRIASALAERTKTIAGCAVVLLAATLYVACEIAAWMIARTVATPARAMQR